MVFDVVCSGESVLAPNAGLTCWPQGSELVYLYLLTYTTRARRGEGHSETPGGEPRRGSESDNTLKLTGTGDGQLESGPGTRQRK